MNHRSPRFVGILLATTAVLVSAPAFAGHPTPQDMPQVRQYAHTVEDTAKQLHRIAERRARYAPRWALVALHRLEEASDHFHDQVERYMADPRHTERDWEKLVAAYRAARRAEHAIHGDQQVSRLFWQLRANMRRLTRVYARSSFDSRRVMQIAHRIDNRAGHLHTQLERELGYRGRLSRDERVAVQLVHRLAEAAEHLHEQVERRYADAGHSRADARKVIQLFESASYRLHWLRVSHHLVKDFEALESSVKQLARIYDLRARHHGYYRTNRRDRYVDAH